MKELTIETSGVVAQRVELEAQAFDMGYGDRLMSTLVADLLQGAARITLDLDRLVSMAPGGLHIRKELREAIYQAGKELEANRPATYEDVKAILNRYSKEIAEAAKENGIMASTGDCRGACKYNTGDSSEYRNYGW